MFRILQSVSCSGGLKNLDSIYTSSDCVLLLDGSTPLQNGAYDACKFNSDFISAFLKHLRGGVELTDAINFSVDELFECFKTQNREYGLEYYPSSTLVIAVEDGEDLKIVCIGDSAAAVIMKDNSRVMINCDSVKRLDNQVIERLAQIRKETNMDICEAVKLSEIKNMMIENRKKMNIAGGYEILSFGMRKLSENDARSFKRSQVARVIFYSDGFDALAEELTLDDANLNILYEKLRREENDDILLNKNPRFKVSDDASAIIFELE